MYVRPRVWDQLCARQHARVNVGAFQIRDFPRDARSCRRRRRRLSRVSDPAKSVRCSVETLLQLASALRRAVGEERVELRDRLGRIERGRSKPRERRRLLSLLLLECRQSRRRDWRQRLVGDASEASFICARAARGQFGAGGGAAVWRGADGRRVPRALRSPSIFAACALLCESV